MSREGGSAGSGGRGGASGVAAQPFPPQFYPVVGYQGPPHAWFPPHPSTGVPAQWSPSWRPPMSYPAPTPPWPAQQAPSTTIASTTSGTGPSDEYTVDTLRKVFRDDDGRVEIQRVKVQRRHPESGAVTVTGPEAMSVVPVGTFTLNERRPPPRRNRRKHEIHVTTMGPAGPYPWYPYMPYMPYPYLYPYYFPGCVWPPGAPSDTLSTWSGNDESEGVSSHPDSALNSQRLESRVSHLSRDSLPSHRSSSPAAASHITDIHSIAPSDSVSVRGRKRETSLERALLGPTPPPRTKSRASSSIGCKSDDAGKTQEWMLEMQRALRSSGDAAVKTSSKDSLRDDPSEVVYKKIPPVRKRRKMKADDMSDKSSMIDLKDIDDLSERQSAISDVAFDDSRLSPELNYAFRKLERSVEAFKHGTNVDSSPVHSHAESPSLEISQSSGEATPTEAHDIPFSDIRSLAEKAKEEEIKRPDKSQRSRAISESVSSLPALETARTGSVPDVSLHSRYPVASSLKTRALTTTSTTILTSSTAFSSAHTTTTTSTTQVTPSSSKAQREGENKVSSASLPTRAVTLKGESVSQVPPKQSSSEDSSEASNTTLVSQPSSVPQCSQTPADASTTTTVTTAETKSSPAETRTSKTSADTRISLSSERVGTAKEPTEVSSKTNASVAPEEVGETSGRHSRASSATTFFSTRTADDSHALDTDSTDIPLPTTDSATADENEESPGSTGPEDDHPWVLQRPEEAPTLNTAGQDERRNAWRAEVSLWRARLVVSLCRGRGLDRQDWATLHLMVHHPLTLDLKLSLLHAPRLCAANSSVGPAVLRVALIQLSQYGETLLQPESARQPGWRSIRPEAGHAWTPVKGAAEILQSLGYQERGDGEELRYSRRCSPEASVVARLTLDMLVLAEEFRLFLTGTHQYPTNVSDLFYPETLAMAAVTDLPQRPPSSEGSFISAQSEAGHAAAEESKASSGTDEDTETLETCALVIKSHEKLPRNKSTSDEDITLRDDCTKKTSVEGKSPEIEKVKQEATPQPLTRPDSEVSPKGLDGQPQPTPPSDSISLNSDVTSLPDLQSSTTSGDSQQLNGSEVSSGNETITPGASPAPTPDGKTVSKASDTTHVTAATPAPSATTPTPTPTPATTNDNPEEHVYEEIDVIRAQVQTIRASSVPTESVPPPLPPKKKVSSGGEDDSGLSLTYPQVEWSSASTPGSLRGGSTGARRKKRRAPMPPEFMPQDWKQSQESSKDDDLEPTVKTKEPKEPNDTKTNEYRRSLNPFYEEIDAVQEEVREMESKKAASHDDNEDFGNPFLETKVRASGYIGKNPFYDDVEIIKKSDEYRELKNSQPPPVTPKDESTADTPAEEQPEPPVVRPKRRAPRPPPTPPAPNTADYPQSPASPQQTPAVPPHVNPSKTDAPNSTKPTSTNVLQVCDGNKTDSDTMTSSNSVVQSTIQVSQSTDETSPSSVSSKNDNKNALVSEQEVESKNINGRTIKDVSSASPLPPPNKRLEQEDTPPPLTPKMARAFRVSPSHPRAPPPPPPTQAKPPAAEHSKENADIPKEKSPLPMTIHATENIEKTPKEEKEEKEETPPPIPPPKAPLSLLDEIPYMDANEVREAKKEQELKHPVPDIVTSISATTTPQLPRHPLVLLAPSLNEDLPPNCPPPPPPCPPPESPPDTPHTSPPDTPHVSPPETPHTSPPVTPHASPHVSPLPSPKPSPLPASRHETQQLLTRERSSPKHSPQPLSRHQTQDSLLATGKGSLDKSNVTDKDGDQKIHDGTKTPPPVPPKTTQQEGTPPLPPKTFHQETNLQPLNTTTHDPVSATHSIQSSTSEERYEIPDTSRAPPPRPPVSIPAPPTSQQDQTNGKTTAPPVEEDRYEVPEESKHPVIAAKTPEKAKPQEAEERYEIPAVVKETPVKRGVNGAPCSVSLGCLASPRRGELASVFGPQKPPRRRRYGHSPPPRPPKSPGLVDGGAPRPSSASSSFTSSSSCPPPPPSAATLHSIGSSSKPPAKRRSWPFLLCDCLYVNCRNYEDVEK